MGYELNLNNDQKRRIDGAKTPEEKAAIIREAMDTPIELSNDELDAASGGQQVRTPPTHEEIDQAWDLIEAISKVYDEDTALEEQEARLSHRASRQVTDPRPSTSLRHHGERYGKAIR